MKRFNLLDGRFIIINPKHIIAIELVDLQLSRFRIYLETNLSFNIKLTSAQLSRLESLIL